MKIIKEKSTNEIIYKGDDLVLDENIGLYGNGFIANNITTQEYELLDVDNIPADYQGRHYTYIDGVWTRTELGNKSLQERIADLKQSKRTQIQLKKNELRDAGFLVGDTLFDSDIAARTAYTELAIQFQQDSNFTTSWKASSGVWVTMDYALYQQVMSAGKSHIENCFAWQAAKEAEINAAATIDKVNAVEI